MKRIVRAEWAVLLRRTSTRVTLAIAVAIPVAVVMAFSVLAQDGSVLQFNDQPITDLMDLSSTSASLVALSVRTSLMMPLMLLVLSAQTLASEHANHVLRDHLVRPVSRSQVLWSKLVSVWAVAVLSLVIGAGVSGAVGSAWLAPGGSWGTVVVAHLAAGLSDLAILVFGFFLAAHFRSSVAVIAVGVVAIGFDWLIRMGLSGLGFIGVDSAQWMLMFMPGTGLNWVDVQSGSVSISAFVCLVSWSALFGGLAHLRIARMDIH